MYAYPRCGQEPRVVRHGVLRAITLAEVVVVFVTIALLALLLAPSLNAAAGRGKTQVCLDNLRSLGIAVRLYAEDCGTLPGPLHAAVEHEYLRDDADPLYQFRRERQLAWKLRLALGPSISDRLITCPVMAEVNPDQNFAEFYDVTRRDVHPTHYAVNNIGVVDEQVGPVGGLRCTNPPYYFGLAPWYGAPPVILELARIYRPRRLGEINDAAREWMIADAWHRQRSNAICPELQQEGPYQYSWSGQAFPNFAPHGPRGVGDYRFTSVAARNSQSAAIRQSRSDGITNTLFFDGHAAGVPSRTYLVGNFEILYGFPGTVNPAQVNPPPTSVIWDGIWR